MHLDCLAIKKGLQWVGISPGLLVGTPSNCVAAILGTIDAVTTELQPDFPHEAKEFA